jgi:hypothetical protein
MRWSVTPPVKVMTTPPVCLLGGQELSEANLVVPATPIRAAA